MKLKISLFNKSIIVSDLKRFWWVSALYGVILFFLLPLQHMLQDLPLKDWQKDDLLGSLLLLSGRTPYYSIRQIDIQGILICTFPIFLAVILFSYLHSTRAATMLHSLPPTRKTLLGSHTASGIALILAPVLFIAVILSLLASFTGLGEYYTIADVLRWACLTLLNNMLFFSIAVFIGMFTGNAIAHIVFIYILNVLPYALYMLAAYNLEALIHGFSTDSISSGWVQRLPFIEILGSTFRDFTPVQGLLYLLTAFVFLVASGFVYNARKLEAAGNIVAFKALQPVFKYGVVLCLMLSGGFLTSYFNYSGRAAFIAAYFIFAFMGYWISQMLLEKTVRVWHAYRGFLIFNAVVILLLAGILTDVTGYAKRVPALEEIESAYFGNYFSSWLREKNKVPEAEFSPTEGLFKEIANIKAVTDLHRALALTESKYGDAGRRRYTLAYILKDGNSVVRKYSLDEYDFRALIKPLYESLEYKEDTFPVLNQDAGDIQWIEIGDRRTKKKPLILSDGKLIQSLTDVMKQELAHADYEEIIESSNESAYIQISEAKGPWQQYGLRRSFKSIFQWLEDNGYYESALLLPEEIDHVKVQALKITQYKDGSSSHTGAGSSIDLTDSDLIKELLDICSYIYPSNSSKAYLWLHFYFRPGDTHSDFVGYISRETPMSEALRQKLGPLADN